MTEKEKPTFDVTAEDYALWLRAGKPPFEWFFRQPTITKEALASVGDGMLSHQIETLLGALVNPELFLAEASGGEEALEAEAAKQLAKAVGDKIMKRDTAAGTRAPTMAGLGTKSGALRNGGGL